ncbi:hypothetical protein CLV98_101466 [Dyadobacter jejuensis]|uniref:Uncharacterized protein n=1 Tax=Dyadobacter jejuensis TaxID=1082580 RepID=A0A316ARD2_9BACT|nr:hypothetical protein [Dyadobacter jejuensis]PWJ60285.1 hypothetical protein CLV98_101466 [Dyadobacter jejuensis]
MIRFKRYIKLAIMAIVPVVLLFSCKAEDPWVDNTVAPLLVDIIGADFGYPIEKQPAVGYAASASELKLSARLLELDKTNILNKDIGIDSIPVAGITISVAIKGGASLGEVTSDADGMVSLTKSWTDLGVTAPAAGQLVPLTWTGSYKGVGFTRYSQVKAL